MSASGSGRDAVFELSQGKLHDAILEYVRSSPEYSCVPVDMKLKAAVGPSTASTLNTLGIQTLALWLDDVAVVPDASGPLVVPKARFGAWTQFGVSFTIDTDTMAQNQGGVLKIPLSTFFDTKQLVMAHPDLLAGADVRVVDNGTLALGVDLVGGDAPNVGNWQQFTGDFRGEHDWAASVSRTVLQQFFDQKLAGALHDNQADRSAPYTLDSLVGTWGNPIRVHGHGAAHDPDCGDIHFRLELEVRLSIGTDHHLWLSTQLVDFSVDYWDGAKAVICHGSQKAGIFGALFGIIVTVFGGAESLANREAPAIPPFDGQDLGEIVYDFPIGGTLKATDLQQSDAGLIVVGDFDISVRSQPQLHISQTSLSFLEVPETFCANTSPPRFQDFAGE